MELYNMSNIEDVESFLIVVFNDFCIKNKLDLHTSADDLLYDDSLNLTEHQKQWLRQFINLWENNI